MSISRATLQDLVSDPILGYRDDALKEYLSTVSAGDEMMLYNSHHTMHIYQVVSILDLDVGNQKRIIVSRSGYSGSNRFYRTGKNTSAPKGQTLLIPVIPIIRKMIGDNARQEIAFDLGFECTV